MRIATSRTIGLICSFALLAMAISCSSGTSSNSGNNNPVPARLYVVSSVPGMLGSSTTGISAFSIDNTGTLTPVAGSPFSNSQVVGPMIADPSGSYLLVVSPKDNISSYKINHATGALTLAFQSPFQLIPPLTSGTAAFSAGGRFLYLSDDSSSPSITTDSFNSSTGVVTPTGQTTIPPPAMTLVESLTANPSGQVLYVAGPTLVAYSIGSDGSLSLLSSSGLLDAQESYFAVAVAPSGNFLYAADGPNVRVFSLTTSGAIGPEINGSPFPSDTFTQLLLEPNGKLGFGIGTSIVPFTIDSSSGTIVFGTAIVSSDNSKVGGLEPSGRFLYLTSAFSQMLSAYTVDQTTGALTPFTATTEILPQFPSGFATTNSSN